MWCVPTRQGWRELKLWALCCLVVSAGCFGDDTPSEVEDSKSEEASQTDGEEAPLEAEDDGESSPSTEDGDEGIGSVGRELDEIFSAVSKGIRFEPYAGVLRGPEPTAVARSGNSVDQALLLGNILESEGHQIRYVRGTLGDENLDVILEGMYPPTWLDVQIEDEVDDPFSPSSDQQRRRAARDHVWVELFRGDDWLPLDPSFPRATIGEAYAEAEDHFDSVPESLFQRVEISMHAETEDGDSQEVGSLEAPVTEWIDEPPLLVSRAIPLVDDEQPEEDEESDGSPAGMMGGMGGALGGGGGGDEESSADDEASEAEAVGRRIQRYVRLGEEEQPWESTIIEDDDPDTRLRREWLEIRTAAPGLDDVVVERQLHPGQWSDEEIGRSDRRYAMTVVAGPIDEAAVDDETDRFDIDIDAASVRADELSDEVEAADDGDDTDEMSVEIAELGDVAAALVGQWIGLGFAATSDELTRRIAWSAGAARVWHRPRVLITSLGSGEDEQGRLRSHVSLDLRLNSVDLLPPPGASSHLAADLQFTRGLLDSVIEGQIVRQAVGGGPSVSTASLMAEAHREEIPVEILTPQHASWLDEADDLPKHSRRHVDEALGEGRYVIIPEQPVELAGAPRWGWWEIEPERGELIASMEGGERQGMVEYTASTKRIGLDDRMGKAIGMVVGATTTHMAIAAFLLEYGEVTDALIDDVENLLQSILCTSCFSGAEASGSAEISAQVSVEAGCFDKSFGPSEDVEVGAKAGVGFCNKYNEGFECAMGHILSNLKGEPLVEAKAEVEAEVEPTFEFGCKDLMDGEGGLDGSLGTDIPINAPSEADDE